MTMGEEGNSSGSDSEPSADNLDEDEMGKILPMKVVKKPPPKKEDKKPVPPKKMVPLAKKLSSPIAKKQPPIIKEISRSPNKRPGG